MREIEYEGVTHQFPDDTPDDVIAQALKKYTSPPSYGEVLGSIPGEAKRQLAETVAGGVTALSDLGILSDEKAKEAQAVRRETQTEREEETPKNMTLLQEGLQTGGVSTLTQVPAMVAGALAAPIVAPEIIAGAVTTAMGVQTGLQKYGETRDAEFTPGRSALHALFHGLVEKYTEYFPVKDLIGKPLTSAVRNFLWKELGGEETATLLQDFNDKLSTNPTMTLGDLLHDEAVTALAVGFSGPVQAGAMRTTMAAMAPFIKPENITPEQKEIIDRATQIATSDGTPLPIPPIGAVEAAPLPTAQGRVLEAAKTLPTAPEGTQRVFTILPENGTQELSVWTPNLAKVQEVISVQPNMRVAYVDMKPEELKSAQEGEVVRDFRSENGVGADEYVLPTKFASKYVYNPAPVSIGGEPPAGTPPTTSPVISGGATGVNTPIATAGTKPAVEPKNAPPSYAVIHRNEEAKTKVRIVFPDETSKQLFLYAKHIGEGASTYAGQQQIVQERQQLMQTFNVTDAEVESMARYYHNEVMQVANGMRQNGTMRPASFSPSVYKSSEDVVKSPRQKYLENLAAANTSPGEVLISPAVPMTAHVRKMQAFLQKWMTMFAPGTRLTIAEIAESGKVPSVNRINGVTLMKLPPENAVKFWAVFSLAHEFGHHLFFSVEEQEKYAQAVAELKLEHQNLVAEISNMNAEEFIDRWMAPNKMVYKNHVYKTFNIKPTDPASLLVEMVDRSKNNPGYMLSFDEYAAEQFARYVGKNRGISFSGPIKEWFEEAVKEIRAFFVKIVAKISPEKNLEKFVNSLIAVPVTEEVYQENKMNLLAEDSWFDSVDGVYDFTTRVIERLPKKDKLQRITILGELARQDVKDQERKLFQSVLDGFDGDVIDRGELISRVMEKIVPITTTETDKWAQYGLRNIGATNTATMSAATEIFRLPFEMSTANHFRDPNYFGHARHFIDFVNKTPIPHVVELQSDLAQKDQKSVTKEGLEEALKDARAMLQWAHLELDKTRLAFTSDLNEREKYSWGESERYVKYTLEIARAWNYKFNEMKANGFKFGGGISFDGVPTNLITHVPEHMFEETKRRLADKIQNLELNIAEQEVRVQNLLDRINANVPGRIDSLPKRWWEFMLRKMNAQFAKAGYAKMRIGTAETIAHVEGWPKVQEFKEFKPTPEQLKKLQTLRFSARDLGVPRAGWTREEIDKKDFRFKEVTADPEHLNEFEPVFVNDKGVEILVPESLVPDEIVEMMTEMDAMKSTYGRAQGIYNRYANEITKFVKKEFGAKEVVGETKMGDMQNSSHVLPKASWLEWDIKPAYGDKPIEYYDLIDSMQNASDSVGGTQAKIVGDDVPNMPEYFKKFNGFLLNSLQLNQIAKLLANVEPLQNYRRLMQALSNLKNQLMDGPNARIKEWYALSKNDSLGIQQLLRDEAADGKHWTNMTQKTITVAGKPMVVYTHEVSERIAEEAKTRGLSSRAIEVYLGIKNDLLNTLGTMEQTILNSIEEFFRNNPIAGTARMNIVRQQFATFRQQPYLPDKRIGQWSVVIRARNEMVHNGVSVKKNEVVYFSGHQRRFQQKREFAQLSKQYGSQFAVTMEYVEDLPYVMRSLPREFIRSLPEQLQLTPEQMARYEELYYDITKEGKYLQLLGMGKKKVAGGPEDLRQSYSNYMWRTANLIAKMAYGRKLQREIYNLNRLTNVAARVGGDVTALRRLHEYMVKNFDYVMRPQHEWEQLRAMVSLWYLWGVPKTALMNSTTLVTTTYPRLAAIAGDAKATGEIVKAIKQVAQYWRDPSKISNEVAALFAQARSDGVTNQSFAAELAAVADGNAIERIMPQYAFLRNSGVKDTVRRYTWKMIHWGMLPFRVTEEFNRRVTLLAAYRIERSLGKPALSESVGNGSAYLAARDTVDYTQNEYAPWNRAKFLQGKKSVALIFFSFMQNMSFFLMGGDKGWWRSLLVIAALSGLEGLPGAENVIDFLDWLGRKTFNEPINLRLEAREMATAIGVSPDYVMHGAMHSMFGLGWDTANSLGMGRIIPGTDAIFGQGDANQRIVQMAGEVGGPFSSLTVSLLQALFDDNPSMLLRFDRALPPMIRNIERGYRGATEDQWTDTKGRALVDEATGIEVLGQLAGFSPTSRTTAQEALHQQKETAQFYVLRRTNLVSALFEAELAKDFDAMSDAKDAIREYNSEVPDPQLRITATELQQSLKARRRAAGEVQTGVAAQRRYRALYERIGDAFSE